MSERVLKGKTNHSIEIYIIDDVDGTPETGVVWNTAGIDLKYRRGLSAVVSITEATLAALTTAHADGGFLEIGNGVYRLDLPDAAVATGADSVVIFGTVPGMIVLPHHIQLVAVGTGAGAITHTHTVTNTVTSLPMADVFVRVTTDKAGQNTIASGITDQNGEVVFLLDAGTVYMWRQKSGFNFDNPDTDTVA